MHTLLFLSMRVLHVVLAGAWLGAVMLVTLFLGPALQNLGTAGPPVIAALVRRGVPAYIASIGGLTIVTGVYLFWRFTGGFDPAISASRAGMMFSIGALTGLPQLAPDSPQWWQQMCTIPLPPVEGEQIHDRLWNDYKIEVPAHLHAPIDQAIAVLRSSSKPEQARKFVAFIAGRQARGILKKYGYE